MFSFKFLATAFAIAFLSSAASADEIVFTLKNSSSFVVTEFYTSPSNVDNWEEDVLGNSVLGSGQSVRITIADGRRSCKYDLRFVFDDGDVVEDTTDLCDTDTYTVSD